MQFSKDFSLILYYTWVYITINSQQKCFQIRPVCLHPLYSFHTCTENYIKHRVSSPEIALLAHSSPCLRSVLQFPFIGGGGRREINLFCASHGAVDLLWFTNISKMPPNDYPETKVRCRWSCRARAGATDAIPRCHQSQCALRGHGE